MRAMVVLAGRVVTVGRVGVECPAVRAVVVARVEMRGRAAPVVWVVGRVSCGEWVPQVPTAMVAPAVGVVSVVSVVMLAAMLVVMGLPVDVVDLVVRLVVVVRPVLVVAADSPVRRAAVEMAVPAGTARRGLTKAVLRRECRVRSAVKAVLVVRAAPGAARRRVG